jgi:peptidyl-tRNA hydrolase
MKMYVIARADLDPGMQLAQSCHALRLFTAEHPALDREWYEESNNLVCLAVPDEKALKALCRSAESAGVPYSRFHEPDLGNSLTAVALAPAGTGLVGSLPLALR